MQDLDSGFAQSFRGNAAVQELNYNWPQSHDDELEDEQVCSNRAATRVNYLKKPEKCLCADLVISPGLCKLQNIMENHLTSLTRRRSVVRIHYRPPSCACPRTT